MTEIVIFGGTSEGRELAELLSGKGIAALACVATEYGAAALRNVPLLRIRAERLDSGAMLRLITLERPRIVIDATHPYAAAASENIKAACEAAGVRLIRVLREESEVSGCEVFQTLPELIDWLNERDGVVFSALGAKEASALRRRRDNARTYRAD
jgi:precorrin-6x reductase